MEENVIQINGGITRNVDVSVKNIYKKDHIWNPSTCSSENGRYLASIVDDSVITCDEKQKQLQEILMKKIKSVGQKFFMFICLFIDYHCIIDSCWYLLLSNKT